MRLVAAANRARKRREEIGCTFSRYLLMWWEMIIPVPCGSRALRSCPLKYQVWGVSCFRTVVGYVGFLTAHDADVLVGHVLLDFVAFCSYVTSACVECGYFVGVV